MGFTEAEAVTTLGALARDPEAMLDFTAAFELGVTRQSGPSARVHATWMFVADLAAASVPVIPFVFLPIGPAMVVSMLVTAALLAGLGVARGRIGHKRIAWTAAQTLLIASAAAAAGVLIGRLVTG